MPGRASALLILGLALSACTHDGPEDTAIAAPGAGIPIGAVGAAGVGFDAPSATRGEASATPRTKRPPRGLPTAFPRDPFADPPGMTNPPGTSGDAGAPAHPHSNPSKGTTL